MKHRLIYILIILFQMMVVGVQYMSSETVSRSSSKLSENFFENYGFIFITEDDGLPHSYVNDIFKDSNGYMWLATHNGLVRYDGYQFMRYDTQTQPVSLYSNYVNSIAEDKFRRLWIATEEGVTILSANRNEEDLIGRSDKVLSRYLDSYIETVYTDKKGNMWLATDNNLLCIVFNSLGRVSEYYTLPFRTSTSVKSILDYGDGICAGIDNMICRITIGSGTKLSVGPLSENIPSFSDDWRILCICHDSDLLWFGTNRGLFKYNVKSDSVIRYRYSNHKAGMLSQAYITDVAVDYNNNLIVSTLNGLNVYNRETDTFSFIRQNYKKPSTSINCNRINTLFCDNKSIWVGTQLGGVNILTPNIIHPKIWRYNNLKERKSKEPNPVNAITQDKNGNLWIATADGGINKMFRETQEFEHYMFEDTNDESISNNSVSGLLIDSYNHLWAYTWGVGINELDLNIPDNRTFIRYMREGNLGLESDFLGSAAEDTLNNGIWFGTTNGLHFYNRETGRFIRIFFNGVVNEYRDVRAMIVDNKNRLWWGTSEGVFVVYLNTFDKENANVDYVYMRYKLIDPDSRQLEKINSIIQDSDGVVWLGSESNGLYRLEYDADKEFKFKNYTTKDGLPSNTIIGIVEDKYKKLWVPTSMGLSCVDKQKKTLTNFTREDGLPDNRFNWNSYYYSCLDDLLYLGTMNELISFPPIELPYHSESIAPVITSWSVAGSSINPFPNTDITDENNCPEVRFHTRDKGFVVTFSTLDYSNSHRIKYSYRLKGYEETWVETAVGECMAKYNYLPAGEYVFQLKATDERGQWINDITEMRVIVKPFFYNSGWFYFFIVFGTIVVIKYIYVIKTNIYKKQRQELELQVAQRTLELENKNKALVDMAHRIEEVTEEKMSFFTSITHEFRTPVTLINGPIKKALKLNNLDEVKEQLAIASRSTDTLLKLVNELLDFRKFDADKFILFKKNIDIISFMDKLLLPFEAFAAEKNIKINFNYRVQNRNRLFDEECLRKVVVNILSNAIKFTPYGGNISVYLVDLNTVKNKDVICIDVRDSGCGIDPKDIELIFQRFYQSKSATTVSDMIVGGSGVGLYLCRQIVEKHGGEIYAGNNRGRGAYVRVILPLEIGKEQTTNVALSGSNIRDTETNNSEGLNKPKILIVDDVADMRFYLYSILKDTYDVYQACDGKEALDILGLKDIDLVITDLMMPVMDGSELSKRMKSDLSLSHIPLLLLTAMKSEEQEKLSLEIGVDDYLCKPFNEELLLLKVRNILSLRSNIKENFSKGMTYESLNLSIESKDSTFMKSAISIMNEHYMDSSYGVDDFIKDIGYSKTLVNNKLHALAGMSIGQFMREFRLNQAKLYITGNKESVGCVSVSDIAYAVGFNDPKYFTKCFKELFGELPSYFLRKNIES